MREKIVTLSAANSVAFTTGAFAAILTPMWILADQVWAEGGAPLAVWWINTIHLFILAGFAAALYIFHKCDRAVECIEKAGFIVAICMVFSFIASVTLCWMSRGFWWNGAAGKAALVLQNFNGGLLIVSAMAGEYARADAKKGEGCCICCCV